MTALVDALSIGARETVAFTGAGGKTTALFRAARELHGAGRRVVVTTTTRIYVPEPAPDLALVVEPDVERLAAGVSAALGRWQIPVAGTAVTSDGKLVGVTHVLVEADGAARLPITAPREDEPVIPATATLVVAVVGVDALGNEVAKVAHRPERVTALTGRGAHESLDARAIARVLLDEQGNVKGAPAFARIVALVNKADDAAALEKARVIAREARSLRSVRVVLAALERDGVRAIVG